MEYLVYLVVVVVGAVGGDSYDRVVAYGLPSAEIVDVVARGDSVLVVARFSKPVALSYAESLVEANAPVTVSSRLCGDLRGGLEGVGEVGGVRVLLARVFVPSTCREILSAADTVDRAMLFLGVSTLVASAAYLVIRRKRIIESLR